MVGLLLLCECFGLVLQRSNGFALFLILPISWGTDALICSLGEVPGRILLPFFLPLIEYHSVKGCGWLLSLTAHHENIVGAKQELEEEQKKG